MKPTVSVRSTFSPPGRSRRRVVASRVAKRRSSTRTPASVSRLRSVDLPAFVYPTMATRWVRARCWALRWVARCLSISRSSASSLWMRRWMRRRSTSSCVSPGPRVPIWAPPADVPPPCWDRVVPRPRMRGSRYRRRASSTWALPSWLWAFWAKMSRITAVRSMAVRPEELLEVALLGRGELVVEHHGVAVGLERDLPELLGLALADVGGRVGRGTALHEARDLVRAGGVDELGELVEPGFGVLGGVRGEGHAHQDDLLPERALDQRHSDIPLLTATACR